VKGNTSYIVRESVWFWPTLMQICVCWKQWKLVIMFLNYHIWYRIIPAITGLAYDTLKNV